MHSFQGLISSLSLRGLIFFFTFAAGIGAVSVRAFQSEDSKARRAELKKQKELRTLAEKISRYGQSVRQQFPTGDVVVSECDLAKQLRKRPDAVVTALNLLLKEQRVQRSPLDGYWRLNS